MERDGLDGNLDSLDFTIRGQESKKKHRTNGSNKSSISSSTVSPKEELLNIASYEKESIDRILHDYLPGLVDPAVLKALEVLALRLIYIWADVRA
jgi:hypothetical protein